MDKFKNLIVQAAFKESYLKSYFEFGCIAFLGTTVFILFEIFGPSLWVKFVMRRYSSEKPEIRGTGGELAKHLIERFSLKDVKVEVTELGDHFDPSE